MSNESHSSNTTYTGRRKNRLSLKFTISAPVSSTACSTGVHDERLPIEVDAPATMPGRRRHGEAA